ncbi:MAG: tetratricopeptide repeat protein [Pseudomonadota bacterium]
MDHAQPRFWRTIGLWLVIVLGLLSGCSEPESVDGRLDLVRENMQRADYGAASLELANLIQTFPDNLEARLMQGKVSLAAGRAEAAEAQLKYARGLGAPGRLVYRPLAQSLLAQGQPERIESVLGPRPPGDADLIAWLSANGLGALQLNLPGRAELFFTEVMRLDKESLDGKLGLAAVQKAEGDFSAASVYLENATRTHPLSIAAWQALGALHYDQGRLVDAERAFVNAIDGQDGVDRPYEFMLAQVGLIETQWYLDKRSLATQNMKALIDSYPWHPLPKYVRGLLAFQAGEYGTAGDFLYRVIAIIPDHEPSLKLLAAINSSQGKFGRAQLYLDQYFELNDNDPQMVALLAETYLQMGNAEESVSTLKPIIEDSLNPAHLDLYGTACRYARSCTDGEAYLRRAVLADPSNLRRQTRLAAAYLNRSDLTAADDLMKTWNPPGQITESSRQVLRLERFLRSGQLDRAVEYAKKLRRENPANLHALLALAEIAYLRGETEEEMAWLELARGRNPEAVEPRIILASRHLNKQRYHEAVRVTQEAASAHPYHADVLRMLAYALINTGQNSEALTAAAEARRLAPTEPHNALALIHANLLVNDYPKAQALIEALIDEHGDAINSLQPMIIELHKRGFDRKAHDAVKLLAEVDVGADLIAEIEGDLYLLEDETALAQSAYKKAHELGPSPIRALKLQLAPGDQRATSQLVPR